MARLPRREKRGHWAKKDREHLRWGVVRWGSHFFGLNGHAQRVINRVYNFTCILNRVSCRTRSLEQGVSMEVCSLHAWYKHWKIKRGQFLKTLIAVCRLPKRPISDPVRCCWSQWQARLREFYFLAHKLCGRIKYPFYLTKNAGCKAIKILRLFDCWL